MKGGNIKMASISLKNIYKEYISGVAAVDDFSLDIDDREFVVLVGPSGCGKSTTLRMIAGLEDVTRGELMIGDRPVTHVPPRERNIAMVFQNYALYPNMTVRQNMEFGLRMRKVKRETVKSKIETAADLLGLKDLLERRPDQLSGGQKQRVALGRAMVREPEVFLLDEPLSNLDARLRAQMRTEITRMHRELGTTFVYVTHDQTEAMTMSDRMVVMKDGRIQQADSPERIYDAPANMFVAGFVGTPQMNFLTARLTGNAANSRVISGGYEVETKIGCQAKFCGEREVILGIRPEDVSLSSNAEGISAVLDIRELMGAEEYLYFDTPSGRVTVRVTGRSGLTEGSRVKLTFNNEHIHLFDVNTENRIA